MRERWGLEERILNGDYSLEIKSNESHIRPKKRFKLTKKGLLNLEETIFESEFNVNPNTDSPPNIANYLRDIILNGYVSDKELWETYHGEDTNPNIVKVTISKLKNKLGEHGDIIKTRHPGKMPSIGNHGGGYYIDDIKFHRDEHQINYNKFRVNKFTGSVVIYNLHGTGNNIIEKELVMSDAIPFQILTNLVENDGKFNKDRLCENLWGNSSKDFKEKLNTQVSYLNRALGKKYVYTKKGMDDYVIDTLK